jgi:uncharacterized membrane protein
MQKFIVDSWNVVMDNKLNPLSAVPDMGVRHMVMQILAWMWCIIFSLYIGSWFVFGISAVAHLLLIAGLCITVATFKTHNEAD